MQVLPTCPAYLRETAVSRYVTYVNDGLKRKYE